MTSPWTVRCKVTADGDTGATAVAGIASMLLFDFGALAVGEPDTETEGFASVDLIAGFDSEELAQNAAVQVQGKLTSVRCEALADESHNAWVDQQREGLQATTIGRWHIRAPWHSPKSKSGSTNHELVIDPGAAFGHGGHPSTALALELMVAALDSDAERRYETIIDLGCGTGILSIVAAKNGRHVRASEHDAESVEVARSNIERNDVATAIELTHGDASEEHIEPSNLVVVNVTIDVHRAISRNYRKAERIIVAGVLCGQVGEVARLLPEHVPKVIKTTGEWAAMDFRRGTLRGPSSGR